MQRTISSPLGATFPSTGLAFILAGLLYSARWLWELSEGILKHMQYPPNGATQFFFIVKLLLIAGLLRLYRQTGGIKTARFGLLAACLGLGWSATTRTIEAFGASGPWGLYSAPGLVLYGVGLSVAGAGLLPSDTLSSTGRKLIVIAGLTFLGGLSAMLLFNLLGRSHAANVVASVSANIFFIAEGLVWIWLGIRQWVAAEQPALETSRQ